MGSNPIEVAMDKEQLDALVGKRIELTEMLNDPAPILPGDKGTVLDVYQDTNYYQLGIKWDSGRSLSLLCPPDKYVILDE